MIIAGPNGSGKSTVAQTVQLASLFRSIRMVDPDKLAFQLRDLEGIPLDQANVAALDRIERWLDASLACLQSVGVETVLSTDKYRDRVRQAQAFGFEITLIYVMLDKVERNVQRVKLRAAKGLHDVPEDKIRVRHARSLGQLPWFVDRADRVWFYDNTGATPELVGKARGGSVEIDVDRAPADLVAALQATETE